MSDEVNEETEENGPTEFDVALETIGVMAQAGASEEDMIVALIGLGHKFGKSARLMKDVLEHLNLRLSAKDRFAQVEEHLTAWEFSPESWDDVDSCANALVEEIDATTKSQAIAAIKKYAKQNDIEMPSKPKGSGGGTRSSKFDQFYAAFKGNNEATEAEVEAWVNDSGVSEGQAKKYVPLFSGILKFAQGFNE